MKKVLHVLPKKRTNIFMESKEHTSLNTAGLNVSLVFVEDLAWTPLDCPEFDPVPCEWLAPVECDFAWVWWAEVLDEPWGNNAWPPLGWTDIESINGLIICPNGLKECIRQVLTVLQWHSSTVLNKNFIYFMTKTKYVIQLF